MGSVNLVVIVESARTLIDHKGGDTTPFHLPSIIAVGVALGKDSRNAQHFFDLFISIRRQIPTLSVQLLTP